MTERVSVSENRLVTVPRTPVLEWFSKTVRDLSSGIDFRQNVRQICGPPGSGKTSSLLMVEKLCQEKGLEYVFRSFDPRANDINTSPAMIATQIAAPTLGLKERAAQLRLTAVDLIEEPGEKKDDLPPAVIIPGGKTGASMKQMTEMLVSGITENPQDQPRILMFDRIDLLDEKARKWLEGDVIGPAAESGKVIVIVTSDKPFYWTNKKTLTDDYPESWNLPQKKSTNTETNELRIRTGAISLENFTPDEMRLALSLASPDLDEKTINDLHFMTSGHPAMLNMAVNFFNLAGIKMDGPHLAENTRNLLKMLKEEFVDNYYLKNTPYLGEIVYLLSGAYRFMSDDILPVLQKIKGMESLTPEELSVLMGKMSRLESLIINGDGPGSQIEPSVARLLRIHQVATIPKFLDTTLFTFFDEANRRSIERELGTDTVRGEVYHATYLNVHHYIFNTISQAQLFNQFSKIAGGAQLDPVKIMEDYLDTYLYKKNEFVRYVYGKLIEELQGEEGKSRFGEELSQALLTMVATVAKEVLIKNKTKKK